MMDMSAPAPPKEPTMGEILVKSLVDFPRYALSWVVGLVVVVLTEVTITTIALLAVASGFLAESVLAGLVVFLAAYAVARVVNNIADAIGSGLHASASANITAARIRAEAHLG